LRAILTDHQKAYWVIGLPCGYTLGLVLGFGGVGLWWGLTIALAVAAGVLTTLILSLSDFWQDNPEFP
jgi:MATE family multidrug resistance protein